MYFEEIKFSPNSTYKYVIYRNSENTDTSATAAATADSETNEGKH